MVGSGAYGKVYRARMDAPGDFVREVAIKLLHEDEVNQDTLGRFRDEARILGLLQDRALVGVEPPHQLGDRWAVVMDFVPGVPAGTLLQQQGAFPPVAALEVIAEIARCLDKAYNAIGPNGKPLRLLHRDIKPNNIQITREAEVKLLDFGIARADFDAREAKSVSNIISGTPGYIAPERKRGRDGPEGDIYSLGVVLWCLVSALAPKARRAGKLQRWSPGVDPVLDLVDRMATLDPEARPTAAEVEAEARSLARTLGGDDLRTWVQGMAPRDLDEDELVGTVFTETPTAPPKRSRLGLYLGVIGFAALAGGVGALVMVGVAGVGAWFTIGEESGVDTTDPLQTTVEQTEGEAPEGRGDATAHGEATTDEPQEAATPERAAGEMDATTEPDAAADSKAEAEEPDEAAELDEAAEPEQEPPGTDLEPDEAAEPEQEPPGAAPESNEAAAEPPAPNLPVPAELAAFDKRLVSDKPARRLGGIANLEQNSQATPALHYLMKHDPDPEVRDEAFYVLVYQAGRGIGDPGQQAAALAEVLSDRLHFSQRKAAHAYGRVGTDLKPLEHVFFRGSPTARNECIRAVVEISERTGQVSAGRALLEKVKPGLTSKTQQKNLDDALAELADP